ncbi:hypothetical protein BGX29_002870 [Mortierella sp. GBA35]|nr:hypothetical protein BGX29_002870 [Mortierella sp. GBA35]
MVSTTLLDITELRDLLSDRLSQAELRNCVLVSKAWHQAFTPPLWSNINISSLAQAEVFSSTETHQAIERHRRLIKSFTSSSSLAFKALDIALFGEEDPTRLPAGDKFTELREISRESRENESLVLRLVAYSPELRTLRLVGWGKADSGLLQWIGKLGYLRSLSIFGGGSDLLPLEDFRTLLDCCPSTVETLSVDLSLRGDRSGNGNSGQEQTSPSQQQSQQKPLSPAPRPFRPRSIKSLSLRGSALNADPSVWGSFLSECRELRSLTVRGNLMRWNVDPIVGVLRQSCPLMEELHLYEAGRHITDFFLAKFLSVCDYSPNDTTTTTAGGNTNDTTVPPPPSNQQPHQQQQQQQQRNVQARWKKIVISNLRTTGPLSNEALLAHAPTLQEVKVMDGVIMDAATQNQLLVRCPHLETLDVIPDRPSRDGTFSFDPLDLLPPPSPSPSLSLQGVALWACETTLRSLLLAVKPTTTLTREQTRLAMRQLGRLHNLEKLHLVNQPNSNRRLAPNGPGFTDFSLANGGLDEWAQMKSLEQVTLLGFKHSFGEEENAWVHGQWPRLVSIHVGNLAVGSLPRLNFNLDFNLG